MTSTAHEEEPDNPTQDAQNGPQGNEQTPDGAEGLPGTENGAEGQEDGETFSRTYVEKLRRESQGYRERAKKSDTALSRLTESAMREATTGVLIDSSDLTYDEDTMSDDDGFPDPEKITQAANDLIEKKPHLAYRRLKGDIGQGARGKEEDFSLAGVLRSNAG